MCKRLASFWTLIAKGKTTIFAVISLLFQAGDFM